MIRFGSGRRVWARGEATDLRKGFAGLAALIEQEMGHDLIAGDLFVFISRNRRLMKLLAWDGSGLVLFSKRLARGRFAEVWRHRKGDRIELTRKALHQLIDGIDVTVAEEWRKPK